MSVNFLMKIQSLTLIRMDPCLIFPRQNNVISSTSQNDLRIIRTIVHRQDCPDSFAVTFERKTRSRIKHIVRSYLVKLVYIVCSIMTKHVQLYPTNYLIEDRFVVQEINMQLYWKRNQTPQVYPVSQNGCFYLSVHALLV